MVSNEAFVEVDTNFYAVPWRLIGETVRVRVEKEVIAVGHGPRELARHARLSGRWGARSTPATSRVSPDGASVHERPPRFCGDPREVVS